MHGIAIGQRFPLPFALSLRRSQSGQLIKMTTCPLCNSKISARVTSWSYYCPPCNHWISTYKPAKSDIENTEFELPDDENVIKFLDGVRLATSRKILLTLGKGERRTLLDVGCASGIFVDAARQMGFDAQGIEPNKKMAAPGIGRGLNIRTGFFPEVLEKDEKFEIITFNDVLEHIEDIHTILDSCHQRLTGNGCLCINVPNSNGLFFHIAKLLGKFHHCGPWNRLWQIMFYTPHLHYFSPQSLTAAVERHNFKAVSQPIPLPVLSLKGLWKRLSIDKESSVAGNVLMYVLIVIGFPVYMLMPKDSFFMVFEKNV